MIGITKIYIYHYQVSASGTPERELLDMLFSDTKNISRPYRIKTVPHFKVIFYCHEQNLKLRLSPFFYFKN